MKNPVLFQNKDRSDSNNNTTKECKLFILNVLPDTEWPMDQYQPADRRLETAATTYIPLWFTPYGMYSTHIYSIKLAWTKVFFNF